MLGDFLWVIRYNMIQLSAAKNFSPLRRAFSSFAGSIQAGGGHLDWQPVGWIGSLSRWRPQLHQRNHRAVWRSHPQGPSLGEELRAHSHGGWGWRSISYTDAQLRSAIASKSALFHRAAAVKQSWTSPDQGMGYHGAYWDGRVWYGMPSQKIWHEWSRSPAQKCWETTVVSTLCYGLGRGKV